MNKVKIYLILLILCGLIFRLMGAYNISPSIDESNHALRGIGFINPGEKLEEFGQSSGLFYVLQDAIYHVLGANQLASRLIAAIFGTLFILLMFLFIKQIFKSEKAGLIGAVLMAFSPFLIKNTLAEQDVTVLFFLIFSALFLFKFLENQKTRHLVLCSILIGLAILIKVYALFFLLSFIVLLLIYARKDWKKILLFLTIVFLFCIPTLAHNYLLYRDKGFVDLMMTNFLKIGIEKSKAFYSWSAGYMPKVDYGGFFFGNQLNWQDEPGTLFRLPGFILMLIMLIIEEPLIMIFGILGFILFLKKEYRLYLTFFLLTFIIPFIYLGAGIPMLKHFVFVPILLIPMASVFIEKIDNKIREKFKPSHSSLKYIFIFFIIFNILWLGKGIGYMTAPVYTPSAEGRLISFRSQIPDNSLVIVDSRIYRGYLGWLFNDKHYLEVLNLQETINKANSNGDEREPIETYVVECVPDDCGWGTIKDQPEFNQSMETFFLDIKPYAKLIKEIKERNKKEYYFPLIPIAETRIKYNIYKLSISSHPSILNLTKYYHVIMLLPLGYDRSIIPIFDDYETHNFIDSGLNKFAHFVLYGSAFLVFGSMILIIFLFIKVKWKEVEVAVTGSQ